MMATNNDHNGCNHDGHNHDDQLDKIYPTTLNELNCTFGISFSCLHCSRHHGHGLWPSWFVAITVEASGAANRPPGPGPHRNLYKIFTDYKKYETCPVNRKVKSITGSVFVFVS